MSDVPPTSDPAMPENARRSRLPLFALLGVVLAGAAGGTVGYFHSQPLYRADAVVQVAPPPYFGGDNPPNDNAVMSAEAYLIASRPTFARAAQGPHWDPAWPTPDQLTASSDRHMEMEIMPDWKLRVIFQDPNPQTAQRCLQAIMLAYNDLKRERAARRWAMTQPVPPGGALPAATSPVVPPPSTPTPATTTPSQANPIVSGPRPAVLVVDPRPNNVIWGALIGAAAAITGGLGFALLRHAWHTHYHPHPPLPRDDEAAPADGKRR